MPLVDVDWFANAGFNCNWLLAENDMLLESPEKTGPRYGEGFYTTIRQLSDSSTIQSSCTTRKPTWISREYQHLNSSIINGVDSSFRKYEGISIE
jgi:hypothetical protein